MKAMREEDGEGGSGEEYNSLSSVLSRDGRK